MYSKDLTTRSLQVLAVQVDFYNEFSRSRGFTQFPLDGHGERVSRGELKKALFKCSTRTCLRGKSCIPKAAGLMLSCELQQHYTAGALKFV